jgi:hypothetical protein
MLTSLTRTGMSISEQRATIAANAESALRELYLAHEITAEEYASLSEDCALITRRR